MIYISLTQASARTERDFAEIVTFSESSWTGGVPFAIEF